MSAGSDTPSSSPETISPTCTGTHTTSPSCPHLKPTNLRPPSASLTDWINDTKLHGYEFNESVLLGIDPDTDWTSGLLNKPNNWAEVAKSLRSEINAQKILARSDKFKMDVDWKYWRRCRILLKEVVRFHMKRRCTCAF